MRLYAQLAQILQTRHRHAFFLGRFYDGLEQVPDDFVALRAHTHLLPGVYEVTDHSSAGEGLARSGRALDRERRRVERARQPSRGARTALALPFEPAARVSQDPWRPAQ